MRSTRGPECSLGIRRVAAVATLLVGCSAQPTTNPPLHEAWDPHGLVPTAGPHKELISDSVRTNAELPLPDESIALHLRVFADGQVEYSEYEEAMFAAAECAAEMGHEIVGPFVSDPAEGWGQIEVGVDPSNFLMVLARDPSPQFGEDAELCQSVWQWRIDDVWRAIHEPTESEIRLWLRAAWSCAKQQGIPLSDPPTEEEAVDAVSLGCRPWDALPAK